MISDESCVHLQNAGGELNLQEFYTQLFTVTKWFIICKFLLSNRMHRRRSDQILVYQLHVLRIGKHLSN